MSQDALGELQSKYDDLLKSSSQTQASNLLKYQQDVDLLNQQHKDALELQTKQQEFQLKELTERHKQAITDQTQLYEKQQMEKIDELNSNHQNEIDLIKSTTTELFETQINELNEKILKLEDLISKQANDIKDYGEKENLSSFETEQQLNKLKNEQVVTIQEIVEQNKIAIFTQSQIQESLMTEIQELKNTILQLEGSVADIQDINQQQILKSKDEKEYEVQLQVQQMESCLDQLKDDHFKAIQELILEHKSELEDKDHLMFYEIEKNKVVMEQVAQDHSQQIEKMIDEQQIQAYEHQKSIDLLKAQNQQDLDAMKDLFWVEIDSLKQIQTTMKDEIDLLYQSNSEKELELKRSEETIAQLQQEFDSFRLNSAQEIEELKNK